METKFTKGTWKVFKVANKLGAYSIETDQTVIARTVNAAASEKSFREEEANAKLIAAAPEQNAQLSKNHTMLLECYNKLQGIASEEFLQDLRLQMADTLTIIKKPTEKTWN